MPSNILVVESDPTTAEIIATHLRQAGHCPTIAYDVYYANRLMSTLLPDLILLNWMLSAQSGTVLTNQLHAHGNTRDIPLIMLGNFDENHRRTADPIHGVFGYVTRPHQRDALLAGVGAVLRLQQLPRLTDDAVSFGGLSVEPAARQVFTIRGGEKVRLAVGPTELSLLYFLMTHPDRAFTRAELIEQALNGRAFVTEKSLNTYIKRLRKSLTPVGCEAMIEVVRGFGYRFVANRYVLSG